MYLLIGNSMVLKFISIFLLIFACSNLVCGDDYQYEKSTDDDSSIQTAVIATAVLVSFIAGGFVASIYFSGNNSQDEETSESYERMSNKSSDLYNDWTDFAKYLYTDISNGFSSVCSYGAKLWNGYPGLKRNFDCEEYVDNFDRYDASSLLSIVVQVPMYIGILYSLKSMIGSIGSLVGPLLSNVVSFIISTIIGKNFIGTVSFIIYFSYYYNNLFVNSQGGETSKNSSNSSEVNGELRVMHLLDPANYVDPAIKMHTDLYNLASRASLYLVDSWDGYGLNKYFDLRKRFESYKLDGFIGQIFRILIYAQTARFVMSLVPWLFSKFLGNTASTVSSADTGAAGNTVTTATSAGNTVTTASPPPPYASVVSSTAGNTVTTASLPPPSYSSVVSSTAGNTVFTTAAGAAGNTVTTATSAGNTVTTATSAGNTVTTATTATTGGAGGAVAAVDGAVAAVDGAVDATGNGIVSRVIKMSITIIYWCFGWNRVANQVQGN